MKQAAFVVLIILLLLSQSKWFDTNISNNTVFIATLVVLLAVFVDLKEFDFWGLRGTKFEPKLPTVKHTEVIVGDTAQPTAKKVIQAESVEAPFEFGDTLSNFVALSFEVDRQLQLLARTLLSKDEMKKGQLSPEATLALLEDNDIVGQSAAEVIRTLRDIRDACFNPKTKPSEMYLELAHTTAYDIYEQIHQWLEKSKQQQVK